MTAGPREGQVYSGESLAARYASFVKLPHTLFALPFAGVGAVLATYGDAGAIGVGTVVWIVVAFTAARFAAMGFNRIVDRRWDALNPRTAARELPAGRLTYAQAATAVGAASLVFVAAAWRLDPLCGMLAPAALAWVFAYSYTKRFTAWSHHVLGLGLGIAPAGAYLAVTGQWSEPWWALPALAASVMLWVGGFDIIYALQDVDFDREHGLRSVPADAGTQRALLVARISHGLAVLAFLGLWLFDAFPVGWIYLIAVAVMAVLLHYAHELVRGSGPDSLDLPVIDRAFFRVNVGVSATFFACTLLDRLLLG